MSAPPLWPLRPTGLLLTALLVLGVASAAGAQTASQESSSGESVAPRSEISGDPAKPRRHFRVRNSVDLTADEASEFYDMMIDQMQSGYRISGDPVAQVYLEWRLANTAPYRSATHGLRYVNNYVNEAARDYLLYEAAGTLPSGAVIAKDSFSLSSEGDLLPGPLFVMEKMEAGFNYVSGDWRYTMVMPDGELFGTTKGINAERVYYCIGCHLVRDDFDHLYFVPDSVRLP